MPHLYHVPSHQRGDFWRDTGDGVDQNPSFLYLHGEDDDHNVIYPGLDGYAYAGNEFVYGYSGPTRIFDYSQDVDIEDSSYDPNGTTISNQTVRLKYDELYDRVSLRYHAWYHVYAQRWNAGDFYYWADDTTWTIGGGTKDSRMSEVCQAARDYNITIYTIGFEVTDASAVVMSDCASSPAHFYRVAGEEIGDAFRSIARQVNELRLIQ